MKSLKVLAVAAVVGLSATACVSKAVMVNTATAPIQAQVSAKVIGTAEGKSCGMFWAPFVTQLLAGLAKVEGVPGGVNTALFYNATQGALQQKPEADAFAGLRTEVTTTDYLIIAKTCVSVRAKAVQFQ
ncbi:MAG: hypothetical protein HYT87_20350 [Nitrospirae bacterium]|nr:hypothetical protein [Nitrospirota bacterium]